MTGVEWRKLRSTWDNSLRPRVEFEDAFYDLVEQGRRKKSVIELAGPSAGHRIKIEAGPDKLVEFVIDDP
jgi:hypothetical protein